MWPMGLLFYFLQNFVLIINSADLIDTVNDKLKSYKYIANLSGSLRSQLLKQFHIFLVVLRGMFFVIILILRR